MPDDDPPAKATKDAEIDSDAVDYEESDDELKPSSGSDEGSGASSDGSIKRKNLSARDSCRQEAKTKTFLMKTMDKMHVRLVKNLTTTYEIFNYICQKYEGAAFHDDPYIIQHYLMEINFEEGSDLTEFFLKLENVMKAASEATESVMAEGQKCGGVGWQKLLSAAVQLATVPRTTD
ncbi:hypothetical protein PHMEG_00031265 [Phytophthora megakarya]|uniref:Uncharacterized protein n=1 Tax=Phytophthora megakarya TaxID=4795 RepID=A0A225UZS2_9STRA|nr:hypothetical protein PHMEG_00031265 [Phytophthora megakarya]